MTDQTSLSFRIDVSTADDLERAADELEVSKSELFRLFVTQGLERIEGQDLEHLRGKYAIESIKAEENLRQRRAWFRSETCSQLWKAWNGGLDPDAAEEYLEGRRREAEEIHEDGELVEYLESGLSAYRHACEEGEEALLGMFTNGRRGKTDVDTGPVEDREDPPDELVREDRRRDREERIEDAVHYVKTGVFDLDDVADELREDVEAELEDQDATPGGEGGD